MGKAKQIQNYQREIAADGYQNALVDKYLQEYSAGQAKAIKDASAQAQYEQQLEISALQRQNALQIYDKSEQTYAEQLAINQANADLAINQQGQIFTDRLTDIGFQFGDLQLTYKAEAQQSLRELEKSQQTFADAMTNYGLETAQIDDRFKIATNNALADIRKTEAAFNETKLNLGIERASRSTDLRILNAAREQQKTVEQLRDTELTNRSNQARAEYNFASIDNIVRNVQAQGDIRSRGQTGVSQTKTQQGAAALVGLNQAKVADNLMRSNEAIELDRKKLQAEAKYNRNAFIAERDEAKSFLDAGGFLDQKQDLARKSTDLAIADSIRSISDAQTIRQGDLNVISAKKTQARSAKYLREKEITETLGITKERFNMNAEILGKTLESAASSTELAIQAIELKRAGNDMQAFAARMLPPVFSADPEAPFAVPEVKTVEPLVPPDPPKQAVAAPKPKSRSTLGTILGIGGAVLGVAGAVFTGGASLAAAGAATTGFWGGGTAAALGGGLSAAGGGLGTIGSYL